MIENRESCNLTGVSLMVRSKAGLFNCRVAAYLNLVLNLTTRSASRGLKEEEV